MNKNVIFQDLGVIDYKKAWDYQEKIFAETLDLKSKNRQNNTKNRTKNYLIFCEHPHVYTLGKSGDESNLLADKDHLIAKQAKFYKINRGGDITYHGPGQIVGYPILDLENFFTDIYRYLRMLEEAIILTIKEYGIIGERSPGETGVWIGINTKSARKICALGVKTSRWVSMHGFALNVNSDLLYFNDIVPCGILDKSVTSMQKELNKEINIQEVKLKIKKHIIQLFNMKLT